MTLHVSMTDLYGNAYFDIDVSEITEAAIKQAIEDNYDEVRKQLRRIGAGGIRVTGNGVRAEGSIVWWWNGSHSLRLEAANMELVGGTSECPKYYPSSEPSSPTCCGFA